MNETSENIQPDSGRKLSRFDLLNRFVWTAAWKHEPSSAELASDSVDVRSPAA